MKENHYNPEVKTMNYFTQPIEGNNLFNLTTEQLNEAILKEFYQAVEWLLNKGYEEYHEVNSNTINPAQQNAFVPLRTYRVKRNGHYKEVNIFHRFWGGCWIEEKAW